MKYIYLVFLLLVSCKSKNQDDSGLNEAVSLESGEFIKLIPVSVKKTSGWKGIKNTFSSFFVKPDTSGATTELFYCPYVFKTIEPPQVSLDEYISKTARPLNALITGFEKARSYDKDERYQKNLQKQWTDQVQPYLQQRDEFFKQGNVKIVLKTKQPISAKALAFNRINSNDKYYPGIISKFYFKNGVKLMKMYLPKIAESSGSVAFQIAKELGESQGLTMKDINTYLSGAGIGEIGLDNTGNLLAIGTEKALEGLDSLYDSTYEAKYETVILNEDLKIMFDQSRVTDFSRKEMKRVKDTIRVAAENPLSKEEFQAKYDGMLKDVGRFIGHSFSSLGKDISEFHEIPDCNHFKGVEVDEDAVVNTNTSRMWW